MTFPAALVGASVRVLRTAAGRRALHLLLLVGGLFALGFLCGEQAHAADGTATTVGAAQAAPVAATTDRVPAAGADLAAKVVRGADPGRATDADAATGPGRTADADGAVDSGRATRVGGAVDSGQAVRAGGAVDAGRVIHAGHVTEAGGVAGDGRSVASVRQLRQLRETVVGRVTQVVRAAEPVGTAGAGRVVGSVEALRGVSEQAAEPVRRLADDASGTVGRTRTAAPPVSVPDLDGLPGLPDLTDPLTPRQQPPAAGSPGNTGTSVPVPAGERRARTGARDTFAAPVPVSPYGPEAPSAFRPSAPATARQAVAPAEASGLPAPAGDPDGALGKQAAVDGTTSRHGDAQAVTLTDRAPLRLAPGTLAHADAPGTRERHRDIPVFPG
ncbi:hypothetical protein [Streptomyces sp. 1222.5]|uniref:hypothetical protein n=1 Tax=Streptomyces sp. 1222.5 TaxID=1881026 RepID=UPI003EBF6E25